MPTLANPYLLKFDGCRVNKLILERDRDADRLGGTIDICYATNRSMVFIHRVKNFDPIDDISMTPSYSVDGAISLDSLGKSYINLDTANVISECCIVDNNAYPTQEDAENNPIELNVEGTQQGEYIQVGNMLCDDNNYCLCYCAYQLNYGSSYDLQFDNLDVSSGSLVSYNLEDGGLIVIQSDNGNCSIDFEFECIDDGTGGSSFGGGSSYGGGSSGGGSGPGSKSGK